MSSKGISALPSELMQRYQKLEEFFTLFGNSKKLRAEMAAVEKAGIPFTTPTYLLSKDVEFDVEGNDTSDELRAGALITTLAKSSMLTTFKSAAVLSSPLTATLQAMDPKHHSLQKAEEESAYLTDFFKQLTPQGQKQNRSLGNFWSSLAETVGVFPEEKKINAKQVDLEPETSDTTNILTTFDKKVDQNSQNILSRADSSDKEKIAQKIQSGKPLARLLSTLTKEIDKRVTKNIHATAASKNRIRLFELEKNIRYQTALFRFDHNNPPANLIAGIKKENPYCDVFFTTDSSVYSTKMA